MCNDAKGTFKLYTFSSQNFHENLDENSDKLDVNLFVKFGRGRGKNILFWDGP